jgi:DNA-binding Lrp family transcriptional regulator
MLKPQDVLVLLKLACVPGGSWTFASIAHELGLSPSAVHRGLERADKAGLYQAKRKAINSAALVEFLLHGARFVFPPERGGEARGLPTAWAAPPLSGALVSSGDNPPVWPDAMGEVRGIAIEPLHPTVPDAVRRDPHLGELLALFDSIRLGDARERGLAGDLLEQKIVAGDPG